MKMRLAPEQRDVVFAGAEDVFVAAAAGSGKTRVLVARLVAAVTGEIALGPCEVSDVLAVTFTDKAAGEIAERVRAALIAEGRAADARQVDRAWISTIHGMCSKILRRHAFSMGLDPRFSTATNIEAAILQQEAFESAARELIESDGLVEQLVIELGASAVARMVLDVHSALRSMGRTVQEVRTAAPAGVGEIRAWCERFVETANAYLGVKQTQTALRGRESARECSDVLRVLSDGTRDDEALRSAIETLQDASFKATGSQELKQVASDAKALVSEALGGLVQSLLVPYETALVRLVSAFSDAYERIKAERGTLDFEDLQLKTAALLESDPAVARAYRAAFRLVMIDEFQDTNQLQLRIARAVAEGDLLTVGDDKQSIYRFRHADVGVFRALREEANAVRILKANYRSHREVVGAINHAFASEVFFSDDFVRLSAEREETGENVWPASEPRVQMLLTDAGDMPAAVAREMEAAVIARRLAELRRAGVPQRDMVVLLRMARGRAEVVETALKRESFDVYVASGGTYFDRPEVEEMTALLAAIDNPYNDEALLKVLAGRFVALSEATLLRVSRAAAEARSSLWEVVSQPAALMVGPEERAAIDHIVSEIETLRRCRGQRSIGDLIHEACERLDYDLVLFASGPDGPRAWANILKLSRLAAEYERRSAGDLSGFLEHVSLHRELSPERQATLTGEGLDAVRIMSVHSAKGLEFPVVVVGDLSSGPPSGGSGVLLGREEPPLLAMKLPKEKLPGGESALSALYARLKDVEAEEDAREADRLLYVACTRARECLILSACVKADKPANGSSDIDRLRQAFGAPEPARSLGPVIEAGEGAMVSVRLESATPPEAARCERPGSAAPAAMPVGPGATAPAVAEYAPRHISYTGLSVYKACPYKYYATRIARLRSPGLREDMSAVDFGSAVHTALQRAVESAPSRDRLEAIARASGLKTEHVDRLEAAVRAYLGSTTAAEVATAERIQRECPFAVPMGDTLLRGSIDLLAWTGAAATIVDYKTGAADLGADEARAGTDSRPSVTRWRRFRRARSESRCALWRSNGRAGRRRSISCQPMPRRTRRRSW